jgi:hypothetical protein
MDAQYLKKRGRRLEEIKVIDCKGCGIKFKPDTRARKFCSRECNRRSLTIRDHYNFRRRKRTYRKSILRRQVSMDMIKELGLEDQLNLRVRAILEVLEEEGHV